MSLKMNIAAFAAALLLSPAALAVVILQPVGVKTDMDEFSGFPVSALIDQVGLTPGYVSGTTDYNDYVNTKPEHLPAPANSWVSGNKPTGFIEFDLGGPFVLSNIALWSGSADQNLGSLDAFEVWIDNILVGSFFAKDENPKIPVQSFDLTPAPATSIVRLQVISNHGDKNNTVISEVAFGVAGITVSEPATVFLVSLFLVGLGFRRNRLN